MRLLVNLSAFLLLFGQSKLPTFPTDKLRNDLAFNVRVSEAKVVFQIEYEIINDSLVVNRFVPPKEFIFDKNGILKTINAIDPITNKIFGTYGVDGFGRILFQKRPDDFINYQYDDDRKISKEFWYNKDSTLIESTIAIYDKKGRITAKEVYRKDSKLSRYWTYVYNDKGDLTTETYINTPNGPGMTIDASITGDKSEFSLWPNDTTKYSYSYGDTITVKRIKQNRVVDKITKSFRNSDTLVFQEFQIDRLNKDFKKVLERKTVGNIKLEEHILFSKHKYYYRDGLVEKYVNQSAEERAKVYDYKYLKVYDNRKNWTSLTTLVNGVKKNRVERIIKYE